jgi:hypothetical protein
VVAGHHDWLVVTLELELWFEEDEPVELEPLDVEPLDVVPLDVVPLDVVPLDVVPLDDESSDEESSEDVDPVEPLLLVVDVSSDTVVPVDAVVVVSLLLACWDAVLVDVAPRYPVAEIVPNARANVASAAATTRRRITRARRARARRRSRTRSEFCCSAMPASYVRRSRAALAEPGRSLSPPRR